MSFYEIYFMLLVYGLTQLYWVNSLVTLQRSCPKNITAMEEFDVKKFLGLWYIYSRYPFLEDTDPGQCETVDYTETRNDNIEIHKSVIDRRTAARRRTVIKLGKVSHNGKFTHVRSGKAFPLGLDIWVLNTDYDNYAVRYMCLNTDEGFIHFQWAAIYTRLQIPTADTIKKAEDVLIKEGIDVKRLQKVDNFACPVA